MGRKSASGTHCADTHTSTAGRQAGGWGSKKHRAGQGRARKPRDKGKGVSECVRETMSDFMGVNSTLQGQT